MTSDNNSNSNDLERVKRILSGEEKVTDIEAEEAIPDLTEDDEREYERKIEHDSRDIHNNRKFPVKIGDRGDVEARFENKMSIESQQGVEPSSVQGFADQNQSADQTQTQIVPVNEGKPGQDWMGSDSAIDKLGKAMEDESKLLLPSYMSLDDIKKWIPKAQKSMMRWNQEERFKGRTNREEWARPVRYAVLEASMGGGAGDRSWTGESRDVDVAAMLYHELLIHGRQTIDEIVHNLGGIEDKLLVLTINSMRQDLFLKDYTEEDGIKTLELVQFQERNRALGIDAKLLEDLERKEKEKKKETFEEKVHRMGLSGVKVIE